MVTEFKKKMEE